MTINDIRFRAEGALLVLQVLEVRETPAYQIYEREGAWRDAKTEDMLNAAQFIKAYDADQLRREMQQLSQQHQQQLMMFEQTMRDDLRQFHTKSERQEEQQ